MFQEMLYALIGSWGRAVIQWALANPVTVGLACGAWLAVIGASKLQMKWLKDRTAEMTISSAQAVLGKEPQLPIAKLYERLYPSWSEMVRKTAFFIPHRWEIWPVPATPKRVAERMDFSPEWLGQHLWANGIEVRGAAPKKTEKKGQK